MNAQQNDLQAEMEARHLRELVIREKNEWLETEKGKVDVCEGLPERAMRAWLRSMLSAMGRTPQVQTANANQQAAVDRELGRKLMTKTARGPLVKEKDPEIARS